MYVFTRGLAVMLHCHRAAVVQSYRLYRACVACWRFDSVW